MRDHEIVVAVLHGRAVEGYLTWPYWHDNGYCGLVGLEEYKVEVSTGLRRLESAGLIERGHSFWYGRGSAKTTRLTPSAISHLMTIDPAPVTMTMLVAGTGWDDPTLQPTSETRVLRPSDGLRDAMTRLAMPFLEEIEAAKPVWAEERRAAEAKGRREYRSWLRRWRAESEALCLNRVMYTAEEVLGALNKASGRTWLDVEFAALMDVLAPGKYGRCEAAFVSQLLCKIRNEGRAEKVRSRVWRPAVAVTTA